MSDFMQILSRALAPLSRKIASIVSRGSVTLVNDSTNCQNLQVTLTADEVQDEIEHMQTYGFTAVPLKKAEAVLLCVGGSRSHGIVVSTPDRRWRPKSMAEGDVCLYVAIANGERVYIEKSTGIVNLGAKAGAEFAAQATKVKTELDRITAAFNNHTHSTGVGPSGPPVPTPTVACQAVAATKVKVT